MAMTQGDGGNTGKLAECANTYDSTSYERCVGELKAEFAAKGWLPEGHKPNFIETGTTTDGKRCGYCKPTCPTRTDGTKGNYKAGSGAILGACEYEGGNVEYVNCSDPAHKYKPCGEGKKCKDGEKGLVCTAVGGSNACGENKEGCGENQYCAHKYESGSKTYYCKDKGEPACGATMGTCPGEKVCQPKPARKRGGEVGSDGKKYWCQEVAPVCGGKTKGVCAEEGYQCLPDESRKRGDYTNYKCQKPQPPKCEGKTKGACAEEGYQCLPDESRKRGDYTNYTCQKPQPPKCEGKHYGVCAADDAKCTKVYPQSKTEGSRKRGGDYSYECVTKTEETPISDECPIGDACREGQGTCVAYATPKRKAATSNICVDNECTAKGQKCNAEGELGYCQRAPDAGSRKRALACVAPGSSPVKPVTPEDAPINKKKAIFEGLYKGEAGDDAAGATKKLKESLEEKGVDATVKSVKVEADGTVKFELESNETVTVNEVQGALSSYMDVQVEKKALQDIADTDTDSASMLSTAAFAFAAAAVALFI